MKNFSQQSFEGALILHAEASSIFNVVFFVLPTKATVHKVHYKYLHVHS